MKRGTAAWILAGSLLAAGASFTACGDDDGGGDEPADGGGGGGGGERDAATDSGNGGGGGRDAATDSGGPTTPDSSTSDGGAAVAAALASAGVDGSKARSAIVVPLACKKGEECNTLDGETVASCQTIYNEALADVPESCADALLDTIACTVRVSCGMEEADCGDLVDKQVELCADYINEDAGT